ncbi:MAG: hypothetical protein HY322_09075 [Betaproteobacteria bacterium]|nr:hypothetical protein [Betaproteobacteria bacterium]
MRDAFAAWKVGMPAVVLVHQPFVNLAKAQLHALGAKDPTMLVYEQDAPALESDEKTEEKARKAAAELVILLSRGTA